MTLRANFRDLAREGAFLEQYLTIETPAGSFRILVAAGPDNWDGDIFCDGSPRERADFRLDYGSDILTLSVPRGGLGSARWVRVGLATLTGQGFSQSDFRIDDALQRLSCAGGSYTG